MKLTAILLVKSNGESDPFILGQACDLSSFGFFQRGAVKEMISFVGRTVAKRTQRGQRQTVQQVRPPPRAPQPLAPVKYLLRCARLWFRSDGVRVHVCVWIAPFLRRAPLSKQRTLWPCYKRVHTVAAGRVLLSRAQPRRARRHRVRGQGVPCPISLLRCQQGGRAPSSFVIPCPVAKLFGTRRVANP